VPQSNYIEIQTTRSDTAASQPAASLRRPVGPITATANSPAISSTDTSARPFDMETDAQWNTQVRSCTPFPDRCAVCGASCASRRRNFEMSHRSGPSPVAILYVASDSQDYNWHPYNVVASAANGAPEPAGPNQPLAQTVGQAAIATIDFTAQLASINEQADQDEEAILKARSSHECQVRRRQQCNIVSHCAMLHITPRHHCPGCTYMLYLTDISLSARCHLPILIQSAITISLTFEFKRNVTLFSLCRSACGQQGMKRVC